MAKTRRTYTGSSVSTTTDGLISASGTNPFDINAYTNWPYGSDPFHVVVEPGTASEEKILVNRTSSGDPTLTIVARAEDGTTAVEHASGSTIYPVLLRWMLMRRTSWLRCGSRRVTLFRMVRLRLLVWRLVLMTRC